MPSAADYLRTAGGIRSFEVFSMILITVEFAIVIIRDKEDLRAESDLERARYLNGGRHACHLFNGDMDNFVVLPPLGAVPSGGHRALSQLARPLFFSGRFFL